MEPRLALCDLARNGRRETGLGSGAVHANAVIKGLLAGMKETLRKGGPVAGRGCLKKQSRGSIAGI
jgi:hypothetical protein